MHIRVRFAFTPAMQFQLIATFLKLRDRFAGDFQGTRRLQLQLVSSGSFIQGGTIPNMFHIEVAKAAQISDENRNLCGTRLPIDLVWLLSQHF
jgi:hypothetical protein